MHIIRWKMAYILTHKKPHPICCIISKLSNKREFPANMKMYKEWALLTTKT